MLALRSGLARALSPRTLAPQVCSSFATGPRQYDRTFYEFRTYCLKPSKMNEFLEEVKKNIHLRTAHSELIGFWTVEFGGRMNKVFHIWKYDNFAHRSQVRGEAVAKDKEWQEKFLIPNLAHIYKQEIEITYLVPWCKLEKPPKEGVYELVIFQMKPGGPALWGDAFKRAVNAHVDLGYSKLVGVFHTEYGALNRVMAQALQSVVSSCSSRSLVARECRQSCSRETSVSRGSQGRGSCSGKCQLPSVSAKYVSDSYIIFAIEIIFH